MKKTHYNTCEKPRLLSQAVSTLSVALLCLVLVSCGKPSQLGTKAPSGGNVTGYDDAHPTLLPDEPNFSPTPSEPNFSLTPSVSEKSPTPTPDKPELDLDGHSITCIVNREFPLSSDFVPKDLMTPDVLFPFADTSIDKAKMVPEAAAALDAMFDAAYEEAKLTLYGVSAYRSYARQYTIYATNLAMYGTAHTNQFSAAPGRSEHQTGLAIDISCRSEGYSLEDTFAATPEGQWVAANAHRFGFILRYPKDKESITGYAYEPWHVRYVGSELAKHLYETDLTMEEYYGIPCQLTAEYLASTPLIDTTADSYQAIYRQYH